MALIEFKNKPNTDTPINDDNLNHNFNELVNDLHYKDGDTFEYYSEFVLNGFVSGGGTTIEVYPIILNKSIKKINSITVNSCSATLRGANGYIDGVSGYRNIFNDDAFNVTVNKVSNFSCKLTIAKPDGFTNITNNTLVSAKVRLSLTLNE